MNVQTANFSFLLVSCTNYSLEVQKRDDENLIMDYFRYLRTEFWTVPYIPNIVGKLYFRALEYSLILLVRHNVWSIVIIHIINSYLIVTEWNL